MPRDAAPPPRRSGRAGPALALALAALATAGTACDEKFQSFLANASKKQAEREAKAAEDAARQARKDAAISPPIRRALTVVRDSDYDFVAVKGDGSRKRYDGFSFAAMLETKTRWLGRGIDDLPAWFDEIGARTFFGARRYYVRLPSGRELDFRAWVEAELAALPGATSQEP